MNDDQTKNETFIYMCHIEFLVHFSMHRPIELSSTSYFHAFIQIHIRNNKSHRNKTKMKFKKNIFLLF